ncbi:unnamed protein product [Oppiella nova]|uniref:SUN domain-containing protein n=1 Tax=Oppiella nova TaxID=334625 RepID=A0A7R9QQG5_9ACAR|nr:unnamed protein product [Oppiella nova]CAG2170552.1 unnamed protein product [Oppiella nova]
MGGHNGTGGTFGAQDERSVQRFPLQNTGFVKFIKVELLSHYGSEHFCPLSVVRVFGTSLFEEVERIDTLDANQLSTGAVSAVDEDESAIGEELVGEDTSGQNLFGSARDAVYDIVRKAAQALNGNQKEAPESTPNETNTGTEVFAAVVGQELHFYELHEPCVLEGKPLHRSLVLCAKRAFK